MADPSPPGPSDTETPEQARRRVWDGLPEAVKANPDVRRKFEGIGDVVAAVARPVAKMIGVDPDCEPCERRRKALNAASRRVASAIKHPFARRGTR